VFASRYGVRMSSQNDAYGAAAVVAPSSREQWKLLVVDDDPAQADLIENVVHGLPVQLHRATEKASAIELVSKLRPELVILDLIIPGVTGMELLEKIQDANPACDVILLTGHYSTDSAVEAIRKGAYDYLTKPVSVERLRQRVAQWIEEADSRERAASFEAGLVSAFQFEGIVGRSPAMREMFTQIRRLAPHFSTALISGETGTGKELVAGAMHRLSPASRGPFVVCNCAAITETLFESELFGHCRGAFTGATVDKPGLAEEADGGTLFLDEVGEMPLPIQAKLLRLIQNREVRRVGSPRARHVNVRIIAATNRNLREMVAEKRFRDDLYYRLAMVEISVPPLRDRKEDLSLLSRHFLQVFSNRYGKPELRLSRKAEIALARYSWPGNVRELENAIDYACMMAQKPVIEVQDLPEQLRAGAKTWDMPGQSGEEFLSLEEFERRYVLHVLEKVGNHRARAAEILGIGRATLYRILSRLPGR